MQVLDKISRLFWYYDEPEKKATIHTPNAPISSWAHKLFGFAADETFEEYEALQSTLVWRAIRVLSEPMASMPIGIYESRPNGDVIQIKDHPLDYILNVEPCKYYSAYTHRETTMTHLLLKANAYSRILYKGSGEVDRIVLMDPDKVRDIFIMNNDLTYKIDGLDRMLSGGEVLHFVWNSFNGFTGKNPIEAHKDTLILDRESRNYAKNFYQNGAFLSGVLEGPTEMTDGAYRRLKQSWQETYGGAKNAGTAAILEEGFKFNPIRLDPVSAAWIETRKMLAGEIARIYGVPLHMIMDLEKATFSNIEHQSMEFIKYSLMPWVRKFEDELNRKLFPKSSSKNKNLFIRYDMRELERGDMQSMADYLTKNQINGNLSINEIRRDYLQKPGIEGGDEHLVQGNNMIPVKNLGQQLEIPLDGSSDVDKEPTIREKMETYSVGVRSGSITPQISDENTFRGLMNLPPLSDEAAKAWVDDDGVRRPITLKSKSEKDAEIDASQNDNND